MTQNSSDTKIQFHTAEVFYYLFWVIMIYAKGTGLYEGMRLYNICLILALFFLAIKLIFTRYYVDDSDYIIMCLGIPAFQGSKRIYSCCHGYWIKRY